LGAGQHFNFKSSSSNVLIHPLEMAAFIQFLKRRSETLIPKFPNSQIQIPKSSQIRTKPYLSILAQVWLAFAFDELATDVAPLRAHTGQPLQ
jgi:hypothetical protein